jgi:uncharacterized protein YuzE
MSSQPTFEIDDHLVTLHIADHGGSQQVGFECVVDFTLDGRVVGFEILNIRGQLGSAPITPTLVTENFRWSYDPDVDATYFRLQEGRGQVQVKKKGMALLDEGRSLVGLRVPI